MSKMVHMTHLDICNTSYGKKKKAGSQTDNLILDHKMSEIDLTSMRVGGVRHTVEKISTRATTLLETLSRLEVWARSYSPAKLWEF
jgi:hypothetical protein